MSPSEELPPDDQIRRAIAGDPPAIEWLMATYLPSVQAFVRWRMGHLLQQKESAEDLAQSVCREALGKIREFDFRGEAPFRQWLFALARSKVRDRYRYYRADKRDVARERSGPPSGADLGALLQSYTSPSQAAIRGEDLAQLETALARLPDDYRHVLVSSRILGMSHAEIADEMQRSEGAVRVLLSRSLVRLGVLLAKV